VHLLHTFTFSFAGTLTGSRGSTVSIVTKLQGGRPEFDSRKGLGFFLLATASRLALRPTQSPIQWVAGVKRPGREVSYLQFGAEVKNAWSYTFTPPIHLHGVVLN
jgi:hypothetical protein